MTKYESIIPVPKDITEFFAAFTGPGQFRYVPGAVHLTFQFEAADLWEARDIISKVESTARSGSGSFGITVPRPTEVEHFVTYAPKLPDAPIAAHAVTFPEGTRVSDTKRTGATDWEPFIPADIVAIVLMDHGIKVAGK